MPCRGCFGPIRKGANPMVDMMGALSSIGLDAEVDSGPVRDVPAVHRRAGPPRPLPTKMMWRRSRK